MHKGVKVIIYFAIFIVLSFFLILTGIKDQKITFAQTKQEISDQAIVILVDNSGSMGRCAISDSQGKCLPDAEQPHRIESVKDVVRQLINQGSFSSSKTGLVELGDWKSYGLNYENRCESVKPLVLPSAGSRDKVVNALEEINANDDGVTPIAYAINYVVNDILREGNLLPKEGNLPPAKIILFTDGNPTCLKEYKYNLCDLVAGLYNRGVNLEIDIFGYKINVKDDDNEFISCAKKYPGMVKSFPSSNEPSELKKNVENVYPPLPTSSPSPITLLPTATPTITSSPTQTPEPIPPGGWKCLFRGLGSILLFIICALCIALVVVIIASLVLPNSAGWVGMGLLKQLVPSDPTRLSLLIAAIGSLAALVGIWANGLTTISCN